MGVPSVQKQDGTPESAGEIPVGVYGVGQAFCRLPGLACSRPCSCFPWSFPLWATISRVPSGTPDWYGALLRIVAYQICPELPFFARTILWKMRGGKNRRTIVASGALLFGFFLNRPTRTEAFCKHYEGRLLGGRPPRAGLAVDAGTA